MDIFVTKGIGTGKTALSAFDAALWNAGVANFNLVHLSSVIPPGARVIKRKLNWNRKAVGSKLYAVWTRLDETEPGHHAYAGIGWAQRPDGSGIFVEHSGRSEEEIRDLISNTIEGMKKRRGGTWGRTEQVISGIACTYWPVSAIVLAAYKIEGW